MRIAYVSFESPVGESGVGKKLRAQTAQWRRNGHEVRHIVLRAREGKTAAPDVGFPVAKNIISPLISASLNWKKIRDELKAFGPDIVYMRELLWWPGLRHILKGFVVVEEVNSDLTSEFKTIRFGFLKRILHKIGSSGNQSHISGRIFVTHELCERFSRPGDQVRVIGNGSDFNSGPIEKKKLDRPQIVMVNSADHIWQGIDLLCNMARRNPDYDFHLVGPIKLADHPENLHLRGWLSQDELGSLYKTIDVGLSTLALYRKGMREACALKVREYSEHEIPAAAGCRDTDLNGTDYFLDLSPSHAHPDEQNRLFRTFVEKWRSAPYPYEDARNRLSSEIKERQRLAFMQSLLTGTR